MTRVLGLDLSLTSTGYCLIDAPPNASPETIWYGAIGFPQLRETERLAKFDEWLKDTLRRRGDITDAGYMRIWPIDQVVIEGYSYGTPAGSTHAFAVGELGGVIKLALYRAGIPVTLIPPAVWRKVLTGKGNLKKLEVPLELYKRYGVQFPYIDTLEAWAVATAHLAMLNGWKPEPKQRKRRILATAELQS